MCTSASLHRRPQPLLKEREEGEEEEEVDVEVAGRCQQCMVE